MDTSVIVVIISVGVLQFERKLLESLRVYVEVLMEIELLEHILHHKVQGVLLGCVMQIHSIEIVAVYEFLILNDFLPGLSCAVHIRIYY
jgi:hypothetical protein